MKKNLVRIFYLLCIGAAAFYCFKRPLYNWDLLPYSALILKMDGYDEKKAFAYTFEAAKKNIPPGAYYLLTDSMNAYRYKLANNDQAFNEQLPFYVVKPLYTFLAYLAYKAGFSLLQATFDPFFYFLLIDRSFTLLLAKSVSPFVHFIFSFVINDDLFSSDRSS